MNYNKRTVCDVDVSGKKVLLRCDFNVPQDKETGAITSDKRIVAALPTIRYLLDHGAAVMSHFRVLFFQRHRPLPRPTHHPQTLQRLAQA